MPTDIYRMVLARIETYWHENKKVPSFQALADITKLSLEDIDDIFQHPDFQRLLKKSYFYEPYHKSDADLTVQQLLCLNVLSNQYDKRSHTQKFREMKITPSQFNRWMQDPTFSRALNERVAQNFHDDGWKVFQSILDTASTGDTNAAKFYMELTGRYTPTTRNNNVNTNISLQSVDLLVEVLMRHLGPLPNGAQLMEAIGKDFESVVNGQQLQSPKPAALSPSNDPLNEYLTVQRPEITVSSPVEDRKRSAVLAFISETSSQSDDLDILEDF